VYATHSGQNAKLCTHAGSWVASAVVPVGSARTDAAVAAALEDSPTDKKLQEYRARLLHIVKASYGKYCSTGPHLTSQTAIQAMPELMRGSRDTGSHRPTFCFCHRLWAAPHVCTRHLQQNDFWLALWPTLHGPCWQTSCISPVPALLAPTSSSMSMGLLVRIAKLPRQLDTLLVVRAR